MAEVDFQLRSVSGETAFSPGEPIELIADWLLAEHVDGMEVRLFWYTSGIGTRDGETVATVAIREPALNGSQTVGFVAPREPYSYSGKLISIQWAAELVDVKGRQATRLDLTLGPDGNEATIPGKNEDE